MTAVCAVHMVFPPKRRKLWSLFRKLENGAPGGVNNLRRADTVPILPCHGFTAMEEEWSSREMGVKLSKHLKLGTDSGWQDEKESVGRWWEVAEPCECTKCCAVYPATGLGGKFRRVCLVTILENLKTQHLNTSSKARKQQHVKWMIIKWAFIVEMARKKGRSAGGKRDNGTVDERAPIISQVTPISWAYTLAWGPGAKRKKKVWREISKVYWKWWKKIIETPNAHHNQKRDNYKEKIASRKISVPELKSQNKEKADCSWKKRRSATRDRATLSSPEGKRVT